MGLLALGNLLDENNSVMYSFKHLHLIACITIDERLLYTLADIGD
jgi:hypothetical protein